LCLPPMPGGTLPFRSVELCDADPLPRSRYRHDLESFFYVLLWMVLYNAHESIDRHFLLWSTGPWLNIRVYKNSFLYEAVDRRLPRNLPLRESWIEPLWKAFGEGYKARPVRVAGNSVDRENNIDFDEETLNNHISYEIYMDILHSGL